MAKFICSILIEGSKNIEIPHTENPGRAKSFEIKRKRALFYGDYSGKYLIPENKTKMSFPDYHKHKYNVNYGTPVYA